MSRYIELKPSIVMLSVPEITSLLPTEEQNEKITELISMLKKRDPVTKSLQIEKLTMFMIRYLFDEFIQLFPVTASRLLSSAQIISNSDFENGVIKILEGCPNELDEY